MVYVGLSKKKPAVQSKNSVSSALVPSGTKQARVGPLVLFDVVDAGTTSTLSTFLATDYVAHRRPRQPRDVPRRKLGERDVQPAREEDEKRHSRV